MSHLRDWLVEYRFGHASDPVGKEGLALLTATLMAKGATRHRSYKSILDRFFAMATAIQLQVDQELTVFFGTAHVDHWPEFHSLAQEMIETPAFLAEDLERVRQELLNGLRVALRGSNDEELAKAVLYAELYQGHPYRHPTVKGLESITLEDVAQCYARMRRNEPVLLPEPRQPEGLEAVLVEKRDARGVAISFGHHIPVTRGHRDYAALLVAQSWLGQHRNGGRLFDSIREIRGLNYGDYAYIEYFPNGMYQFEPDPCLARRQQIFQVWIRPVEPAKAIFALRLALYEIASLQRDGISEEDFERTRNFLRKYVRLLVKTGSLRERYAVDSRFYGTGEYTAYLHAELSRVTLEEVNRAARQYLSVENLCLAAVGPEMASFGATLQSGAVTGIEYEVDQPEEVLAVDAVAAQWPLPVSSLRVIKAEDAFER